MRKANDEMWTFFIQNMEALWTQKTKSSFYKNFYNNLNGS